MPPSRKVKRSLRRGKKMTRRRQRGGNNAALVSGPSAAGSAPNVGKANAAGGKTYTLSLTLPLSTSSTYKDFPSDLGQFSGLVQGFSFTNPTKKITDIHFVDNAGKNVADAAKYGTSSSSSAIKIKIGNAQNLVPSYVPAASGTCAAGVKCVRGATPLGPSNGQSGAVTVNNLTQNNLNAVGKNATGKPVSQTFTVKVVTSN